jgi:hypothetical protein
MVINEEVKKVIEGSAFLVLVTVNPDGSPHPIVAGKGKVSGDNVIFGVYKMERTRKNIKANSTALVPGAVLSDPPLGYRLTGTAAARETATGIELIFTATCADRLL